MLFSREALALENILINIVMQFGQCDKCLPVTSLCEKKTAGMEDNMHNILV